MRTFIRRHAEACVVIPLLVLAVAGVWWWTWWQGLALVELGPILTDFLIGLIPTAMLGYLAWLWKREYWHDLSEQDERDLHARAANGNRHALLLIVKDRIEWIVLFCLLLWSFGLFSGQANANPLARELIVRWEVTSPQAYTQRWQRPIWPGGASGVTWGIGYDGGHQPAHIITRDWSAHPQAGRLSTTAGIVGDPARALLPTVRDITTPWPLAVAVLDDASIPRYLAAARRAYGPAFDRQTEAVKAALTSEVYNRGQSMTGSRRAERRVIRDVCLPADDAQCVADQLRASCRVWANDPRNGPGLCARRQDEARAASLAAP